MRAIEPRYRNRQLPAINQPLQPLKPSQYDPLKLCIFTTIAVISWIITPAAAVTLFAAVGLSGYWKARRAGLLKSRCLLGDTRLVILYLATALLAGGTVTALRIF